MLEYFERIQEKINKFKKKLINQLICVVTIKLVFTLGYDIRYRQALYGFGRV